MDTTDFPFDLVVVRHGETRGSTPEDLDHTAYHDPHAGLTKKGVEQARAAGEWIKKNIASEFEVGYTTEYVRAMETAGLMSLKTRWVRDIKLCERSWGELEKLTRIQRREAFRQAVREHSLDVYFWQPAGGESMHQICTRLGGFLDGLRVRDGGSNRVVIATHGGICWASRVLLEHMSPARYQELNLSDKPEDKIRNGLIFHYTRCNPESGELAEEISWMRMAYPLDNYETKWIAIPSRQALSNTALLREAKEIKKGGTDK